MNQAQNIIAQGKGLTAYRHGLERHQTVNSTGFRKQPNRINWRIKTCLQPEKTTQPRQGSLLALIAA